MLAFEAKEYADKDCREGRRRREGAAKAEKIAKDKAKREAAKAKKEAEAE